MVRRNNDYVGRSIEIQEYKDTICKVNSGKFLRDIREKKAEILKKFQMLKNENSLPKMKKKLEESQELEGTNRIILPSLPTTKRKVDEEFIIREDELMSVRSKTNPYIERRNNPAIVPSTHLSPFLSKHFGQKLTGHNDIKVNVSRFKPIQPTFLTALARNSVGSLEKPKPKLKPIEFKSDKKMRQQYVLILLVY
jgi:hypothetical protein